MALQVLYDKCLFDNYGRTHEVLKEYSFVERRLACLDESKF